MNPRRTSIVTANVTSEATRVQLPATCEPPSENNPPKELVWVIFGATGHIGRSLVRTALHHGDRVVAVGRTYENKVEQMQDWHPKCIGKLCDVRLRATVEAVIQETVQHFRRIDVIANCTGYGVVAAAEDQSNDDVLNQFNTNFLGTLHIIQASLTYFRTNGIPGRYLIFSSTAGALGVPGLAPYCATKYAVEGLVESMLYETDTFNIKATLVEPGHLRLDDDENDLPGLAAASAHAHKGDQNLDADHITTSTTSIDRRADRRQRFGHFYVKGGSSSAYSSATSPAGHAKRVFQWLDARQPTSSVRSAELVWQLGHCTYPPLRLLLGAYAVESIRDRLRSVIEEIEDWKHLSFNEDGEPPSVPKEDRRASVGDVDSSEIVGGDQDDEEHDQMDFEDGE